MKLFGIFATLALAQDAADNSVTISNKEKQKINHLKKNWPIMVDLFFTNNADAKRPVGAQRFADNIKNKMAVFHDQIVEKWEECGRASLDDSFDPRGIRFDTTDAFKGIAGLTNQYKKFIEAQIMGHCDTQTQEGHYLNRVKLIARMLRYKYCKYVDDSNVENCAKVANNPRKEWQAEQSE